jgi:aminocarboxymuconate-semialdehyde decarboxylase
VNSPVIDLHAHHLGADLLDAIEADDGAHGITLVAGERGTHVKIGERRTGLPAFPALSDTQARLAWMDANAIDRQLVCGWMDLAGYHLPAEHGHWLAARQNDALARLAREHPDRVIAAAMVPLQDPQRAVAELRRAVAELGHRAVQIGARVNDQGLDDPAFEPFWAAAEELGTPVLVHPAELDVPDRVRRLFLQILVGNPSDTTFAAAALLLGGVLERHPALRTVLVHGGGFLPYQFGRVELGFERAPGNARPQATRPPSAFAHQLVYDTIVHDDLALSQLLERADAGQVVLGSDYPFPMQDQAPLERITRVVPEGSRRDAVTGTNAAALLRGPTREESMCPPPSSRSNDSTSDTGRDAREPSRTRAGT